MAVGDVPLTPIIDTVTGSVTEIGRIFLRTLAAAVNGLAPIDASYWTSKATAVLTSEINLGALASGYLKLVTAVGIGTPTTVATIPQADITGLGATLATFRPILPRVTAIVTAPAPAPNADTTDVYSLTALATAAAFANPAGTLGNAQQLRIRIKDNGTARALTWGAAYAPGGVALPTTTIASKTLTLTFLYNNDNGLNRWQLVHSAQEA